MNEKYYTTAEVAELLKISDRTVRNLCIKGDLEHNKVGVQIRISETHLNNYLNKGEKEHDEK